ncbi:MAG TPA: hypothetical protein VG410_15450 [Solirubrobacteraceae bacterium]|nr:hypothetical protein [Solirubrobacteraceae bacterium]
MDKDFDDSWVVPARPRRPRVAPAPAPETYPELDSPSAHEPYAAFDSGAAREWALAVAPEPVQAPGPEPHRADHPSASAGGVPGRRTITIRGQVARPTSRRPPRTVRERAATRPDRIAMWAVLLGFVLLLVAATSSHAAVIHALAGSLH